MYIIQLYNPIYYLKKTVFNAGNTAGFQPAGGQAIGTGTGIANPGPGWLF